MSKRTSPSLGLALLMLFAGIDAHSRPAASKPLGLTTLLISGAVSSYEPDLGIATIGDANVYVRDVVNDLGIELAVGDQLDVVGNISADEGLVWAIALKLRPESTSQSITGTGISLQSITGTGRRAQSITGTGKQSIIGTGISVQSITGTGKQSITGTGKQSITGTGLAIQSITGTGIRAESITGTGKQSITGTGKQSITGTGLALQSITGTGIRAQSITGTGK